MYCSTGESDAFQQSLNQEITEKAFEEFYKCLLDMKIKVETIVK